MTGRLDEPTIAAAVIVHAGRVLLLRRRVPEGALHWQFPAGKVEPGERVDKAAAREALEETGLSVEPVRYLGERVHPATGRLMSYTACRVTAGRAHAASKREVAAVAWVAHGEIPEYVPYGLFHPVQDYLDGALTRS